MNKIMLLAFAFVFAKASAQSVEDSTQLYKKRVLESTEVNFLFSYYNQDGENAAVSGGFGSEELEDRKGSIIIAIPLTPDDVLTLDYSISVYTSASSSNVGPFDDGPADPFQASTGASAGDLWANPAIGFSHSSDDRNSIWSARVGVAAEHDYFSIGVGGNYSRLFNEKNTELTLSGNVFIDNWLIIYPVEMRPFAEGGSGLDDQLFTQNQIIGNRSYQPQFNPFENDSRNSYSLGLAISQILHKNVQGTLSLDVIRQEGLLSTPFQRVYFKDVENSFIDNFQLAEAIEILPGTRFKIAIGGRLNWYLNERLSTRTFYRFYYDDWGILSQTVSLELPLKVSNNFTLYPSYRFYNQTASDYFRPYEEALSTEEFYTSDYDLSGYLANQVGFGVSYTDVFTSAKLWRIGLKSIDLKYYHYNRNTTFASNLVTAGIQFIIE